MNERSPESPVSTIIVSPRDRYSGVDDCLRTLYRCTPEPIAVWVLDLGYPQKELRRIRKVLADKPHARIIPLGLTTPMEALRTVRMGIETPNVVLLDNDSRVTPGWLPPLLARIGGEVAVVSPLTLETLGVDEGAALRNHLYTGELRLVTVDGRDYLIEQKHYRRTPVGEIPTDCRETGSFELHCVMFDSAAFKALEFPAAVVREHLDIALQVRNRGQRLLVEPASRIVFDNLGTRMHLRDMRFFWYRWSPRLNRQSVVLFDQRWGYHFYSELASFTWVVRRKAFLLARWFWLPVGAANLVARVAKHFLCREWDPLPDAEAASRPLPAGRLPQLGHGVD